jgi:hypothetical protein
LDTWTDPSSKAVWTLAIAKEFAEAETAWDNYAYNDLVAPSPVYQIVPPRRLPTQFPPTGQPTCLGIREQRFISGVFRENVKIAGRRKQKPCKTRRYEFPVI